MKKSVILLINVILFTFCLKAESNNFFKDADAFLKAHVSNGNVKYKQVLQLPDRLNELIAYINNANIETFTKQEKKAFYLNAYNLLVIKSIIKVYPISSPMDVDGFFDKQKHTVAREQLTLNELENKKIREVYHDSRIHFALVCAAKGCPKIADFAFMPSKVDAQLEQLTKNAMNDVNFTKVKHSKQQVQLSEIFNWYKQDFIDEAPNLLAYINKYRTQKINENYKVSHYTYDWQLNEVGLN
ncbi:MAG: DUF547 domain-containing protein [Bacteroidota bacterium]